MSEKYIYIDIYIYLLCAFNVFKSTLNELKIFIRTFKNKIF